jgi:glycosyltransferase involved in cell wall biosynthesis
MPDENIAKTLGIMQDKHSGSAQERLPLVSIITAVLNAQDSLAECIESVLAQDYPNVEHIILDGGSLDKTVDILRVYEGRIAYWKSEPDKGVYDAWNKGLGVARGEWIGFLGADDRYTSSAISSYMQAAEDHPDVDYLSSQVEWQHSTGYSRIIGGPWSWSRFRRTMCSAHVGSLHHRRFFEKYGKYDTSYRITADYELLLRAGTGLRSVFVPELSARMKSGGLSDSVRALREACRAKMTTGKVSKFTSLTDLYWAIAKYKSRGMVYRLLR